MAKALSSTLRLTQTSAWMEEALCSGLNTNINDHFVYGGGYEEITSQTGAGHLAIALEMCQKCPVKASCLEYGLETNETTHSVYGGEVISPKRKVVTDNVLGIIWKKFGKDWNIEE